MKKSGGFAGGFWFAGWMFTMGMTHPAFYKWLLGLIVWPFYLGEAILKM